MRHRVSRLSRRAWLASAALHAVAAAGLYLLLPAASPRAAAVPVIASRADSFQLSLELPGDEPPANVLPAPRIPAQPPAEPESVTEPGRMPTVTAVPAAIPDDLQMMLRDLAARPTPRQQPNATEFPLPAIPPDVTPAADIQPVEPVAPPSPAAPPPAVATSKLGGGKPIHGPLPDGTVAVYLLDRSASMGLNRDTFDAARAALIATVAGTPTGAKVQVLTYHTTATPVLPSGAGKLLVCSEKVTREITAAVAELKAEGNSAHEPGLKAAVALGADYVIWITDASDEELAKATRALKAARKPVAVYVARAANGTVAAPAELR